MSDLVDVATRVPFLVWVMVIGPLAYAAVALIACARSERQQIDPAARGADGHPETSTARTNEGAAPGSGALTLLERRAAIREEYLAWRHPRRVHRGRK